MKRYDRGSLAPLGSLPGKKTFILFLATMLSLLLPLSGQGQTLRRSTGTSSGTSFNDLMRPSTSKASAQEALKKIPWPELSVSGGEKARQVLAEHTIYRRLPMAGGHCNPELFDFILCHPETIVAFWDVLGYPGMKLQSTGQGSWYLEEKAGTTGNMEVLYQDNDLVLLWARGQYKGPGTTTEISGDILLILQIRYTEDPEGDPIVICRMDSFVRVYNVAYEMMSKMFAPLLGRVADSNFGQTVSFVSTLSQAAEENPAGLANTVNHLTSLTPELRQQLAETCGRIERQADQRAMRREVVYTLLPKKNVETATAARILAREERQRAALPGAAAYGSLVPIVREEENRPEPDEGVRVALEGKPSHSAPIASPHSLPEVTSTIRLEHVLAESDMASRFTMEATPGELDELLTGLDGDHQEELSGEPESFSPVSEPTTPSAPRSGREDWSGAASARSSEVDTNPATAGRPGNPNMPILHAQEGQQPRESQPAGSESTDSNSAKERLFRQAMETVAHGK